MVIIIILMMMIIILLIIILMISCWNYHPFMYFSVVLLFFCLLINIHLNISHYIDTLFTHFQCHNSLYKFTQSCLFLFSFFGLSISLLSVSYLALSIYLFLIALLPDILIVLTQNVWYTFTNEYLFRFVSVSVIKSYVDADPDIAGTLLLC